MTRNFFENFFCQSLFFKEIFFQVEFVFLTGVCTEYWGPTGGPRGITGELGATAGPPGITGGHWSVWCPAVQETPPPNQCRFFLPPPLN